MGLMAASRILIVDDEESVRHQLSSLLALKGYEVETAADAEQALEVYRGGDFDLVVCDVRMPGMGGMEFLESVGGPGSEAAVIMMSAYGDIDMAREAVRRGASDYLNKPYKNDEVLLRICIAEQRQALRRENLRLKRAMREESDFENIVGRSAPMEAVFRTVEKIADFKSTVLISGESGTGKELLARAIHQRSPRRDEAFVAINCGAIPENLLESELFGHARGAFTDAVRNKQGLFEEADRGTLFLDEIGELPLGLQVKLLRVLQEEEIRRVGENRSRAVDVRILAATIRDLAAEARAGRFREDLFYRLNVLTVRIPPLRERPEDIPLLVEHFLVRCNAKLKTAVRGVEPGAMKLLVDYEWPGNVRELENLIERAVILCDGEQITPELLTDKVRQAPPPTLSQLAAGQLSIKKTVRAIEEELIRRALAETGGNRTRAARLLEISHRTLLYKLKDYGVDADSFSRD
ncbi:MAG: sigma-54-dependent Fis family transcriptional regulator [Deltaproteobacteria bacterium]|nr:sigma-54-dependent Fis family transcriptional regulator [Deltaproteobacteria bacterium]